MHKIKAILVICFRHITAPGTWHSISATSRRRISMPRQACRSMTKRRTAIMLFSTEATTPSHAATFLMRSLCVDLRAVQRHRPHLQNAHLPRQQQHLNKQSFDLLKKASPECRDRVVVGMIVGRDEPERHRVVSRTLQRRPPADRRRTRTPPHPLHPAGTRAAAPAQTDEARPAAPAAPKNLRNSPVPPVVKTSSPNPSSRIGAFLNGPA